MTDAAINKRVDHPKPPFEVINPCSNRCMIKVKVDGVIEFHSITMEQQFKIHGIHVPSHMRNMSCDRQVVKFDDDDFNKAFIEIAWYDLLRGGYKIVEIDDSQSSISKEFGSLKITVN